MSDVGLMPQSTYYCADGPHFDIPKQGAVRTFAVSREISSPTKKLYSSGQMGCVSTSTEKTFASAKIFCMWPGGSSGDSEKKKSAKTMAARQNAIHDLTIETVTEAFRSRLE